MKAASVIRNMRHSDVFKPECFPELSSTNAYLAAEARNGAPEWQVAVAEQQTQGKGRHQRLWESPPGLGIWFSMLLRPKLPPVHLNLINLYTAYSLATYLESVFRENGNHELSVDLKWPNDLFISGKKISGILLEGSFTANSIQYVVVGIGINVKHLIADFPPELREKAASLQMFLGKSIDREKLLAGFLDYFYDGYVHYAQDNFSVLASLYTKKVLYLNEKISVSDGSENLTGVFRGISPEGYLLLERNGQQVAITAGDVFGENLHREG